MLEEKRASLVGGRARPLCAEGARNLSPAIADRSRAAVFSDLREYIDRLEAEGELQTIEAEVDWDLEVGAVIRRSYDLKAPAPFFENIKGYPRGYRILGAPIGTSAKPNRYYARLALSLGLPPDSSPDSIMEEYSQKSKKMIKPVVVKSGPCKENIQTGDEIDLYKFPVPVIHEGDGGRYIGTWHMFATRDPDSGWVNWGMYRLMLHDRKTLGIDFGSTQHGYFHYKRAEELKKPLEFAVAIGTEPATPVICATRIPPGIPEVEVIGGIRGEPLELVPCETVDHLVPATSEIVIEGMMYPNERELEGPFGEYTGYRAGDRAPRPVCHVTAITHRNNPILPVSCMGVPVDDWAALRPVHMAGLAEELKSRGFPIRQLYSPPEGTTNLLYISTKVPYPYYPQNLAAAIWSSQAIRPLPYHLFIFDEDIDVTNIGEVIWAFSTRCHPERGIHKFAPMVGGSLIPFLTSEERRTLRGARVLFDCTWPKDWEKDNIPVKASFDTLWPEGIQDRVLRRWREYGYPS